MMSRNEALMRVKLLMQKTVSHGPPSPKLEKMLEVLIDHFKVKDPSNSRVIIFSNFRGSVRDILDALASIKATEFIGQSSGKTSKGQSQKVKQAVLQAMVRRALRATYCARIIMSDVNKKKSEVRRMVVDFYNSKPGLINAEIEKRKAEAAGHKKKKKMKH